MDRAKFKWTWPQWKEDMAERGIVRRVLLPYPENLWAFDAYCRWFEQECKAGRSPDFLDEKEEKRAQAIESIQYLAGYLGRTPSSWDYVQARRDGKDIVPLTNIQRLFGLWENVVKAAGLEKPATSERSKNRTNPKRVVRETVNFWEPMRREIGIRHPSESARRVA